MRVALGGVGVGVAVASKVMARMRRVGMGIVNCMFRIHFCLLKDPRYCCCKVRESNEWLGEVRILLVFK